MTDKQIVRALECCLADKMICDKCPIQDECESHPLESILAKYALDLIKRLQFELSEEKAKGSMCAEVIARQDKEIERLEKNYLMYEETTGLKKARTEAVREFAERLKKELNITGNGGWFEIGESGLIGTIDNLVKEMTGGKK